MRTMIVALLVSLMAGVSGASVIYVAPKDSADYEAATKLQALSVERTLHKALNKAAEELNKPGPQTVIVKVAEGSYTGQAGAGNWVIPQITNPEARLKLVGGYLEGFTKRGPFGHQTKLETNDTRSGAFIGIEARSELAEFVVSGFVMDAAASNVYDDGVLIKSSSTSYPLLGFSNLTVGHLQVCDNVFINGAHGAFDPYIQPQSEDATVTIENNFFLNTVKLMQLGAGINPVKEILFKHNTVVLNWPFNPDPTSSLVGAINLHNQDSTKSLVIEGNIFAHNVGGALQHDWTEDRMPELTIRNNLFWQNGSLLGATDPGAAVVVGKFGTNPKYLLLDLDTLTDDFDYTVEGNVVADPKLGVASALQVTEDEGDLKVAGYATQMPVRLFAPVDEELKVFGVQAKEMLMP
jgi:hypothetical protein